MSTSYSGNSGLGDNLVCLTKKPPMPVFTEYRDRATSTISEASGRELRPRITPPMLQQIASLPPARIVKILEVREQLARGTYGIDKRLDAVLDRLLADIKT
jgi:hypothetical protein